jgi:DNA-binding response OmpR family regulator
MHSAANILVVDDDDDLRAAVRAVLEMEGYSVEEASGCGIAMSLLGRKNYDLVLLDIALQDGSGFEVIGFMKENQLSSRIIMMTGTSGLENALRSVELGAEDYITKPFSLNYLLKAIQHALSLSGEKEGLERS